MKKTTTVFLGICTGVLLFLIFAYWSVESPAVPIEQLNQIKIGMTMAETERLLGHPYQRKENTQTTSWIYGHPLKWYSLTIDFDAAGKITSCTHDD
jgi:hypothetical protein